MEQQKSRAERLYFPGQRSRSKAGPGPVWKVISSFIVLLLLCTPLGFFALVQATPWGRAQLTDTALAIGLGEPVEAQVDFHGCSFYRSSGRGARQGHQCAYRITTANGEAVGHRLEVDHDEERLGEYRQAGRAFGRLGVYFPARVMFDRWDDFVTPIIFVGMFFALGVSCIRWAREAWPRAKTAQRGRIRPAALLTFDDGPWFSYVDEAGERRFERSDQKGPALLLDAAATEGAVLVRKNSAVLVHRDVELLGLSNRQALRVLASSEELIKETASRVRLEPSVADAEGERAWLDAIEQELTSARPWEELWVLYRDAWRLAWNSADPTQSGRAFDLRSRLAIAIGAEAAFAIQEEMLAESRALAPT